MRNRLLAGLVALALMLGGCQAPSGKSSRRLVEPKSYTRVDRPDTNTVQLQIALRKFVPRHQRGATLWLAGVMHVGEPEYYQTLQTFLGTQTVVLYEGVNTGAHIHHVNEPAAKKEIVPMKTDEATNAGFSMQSALAGSLGLVFQLDSIDYERTNFINSDLSIAQIQTLMTQGMAAPTMKSGETNQPAKTSASFDALLEIMDGSSFLGKMFKLGIQFIGANPKLQAMSKLTLIEMIGQIKGDFSEMQGLPSDMKQLIKVLIEARNQNVIADLKTELKRVPKFGSIAVFYGTGHMEDLEKRIVKQLNYQPVEEKWLTVFAVDIKKSGLSPGEAQMMRNLVKYELDQMK